MSYSNPQRIRNKEFDALDKTTDTFNKTSQGFFDVVRTQKAFDKKLQEENIEKESQLKQAKKDKEGVMKLLKQRNENELKL